MVSQRSIGAVYQMSTECGSLYLQHVGSDATFGTSVAVFSDSELSEFRFSLIFPLGSAVKQRIVQRIGRSDIPQRYKTLRFRYPLGPHGAFRWMIVEGTHRYKVERLSHEQVGFVLAVAVNDTALKELFCKGWVEGEPFPKVGERTEQNGS